MPDPAPSPSVTEHATQAVHQLLATIIEAAAGGAKNAADAEAQASYIERLANACESVSRTALRWKDQGAIGDSGRAMHE